MKEKKECAPTEGMKEECDHKPQLDIRGKGDSKGATIQPQGGLEALPEVHSLE